MPRVLYLDTSSNAEGDFYRERRNKIRGVTCVPLYKRKGIINKALLGAGYYFFAPLLYLIYGDWKKHLDEYDIFIVSSRRAAKHAVKFIKRKTCKRVIVWYWNIVSKRELPPEYCRRNGCETWSFDKEDCGRYGMKFGDTYYFDVSDMQASCENRTDLFYVGVDKKGRGRLLKRLEKNLEASGLKSGFHLVKNPEYAGDGAYPYSDRLEYGEVMKGILGSRAILDLTQDGQSGLTLRPLEALTLKKKLVTNNPDIVDSYAYDDKNTYIIDEAGLEGLSGFLKQPYRGGNEEKAGFYTFENWLERICGGIEAYPV